MNKRKKYNLGSFLEENIGNIAKVGVGTGLSATGVGGPMGIGLIASGVTGIASDNTNDINSKKNINTAGQLAGTLGTMSYATGGNTKLSEFNNGGTHEENPLGGIPLGKAALVEEGETKWEDYIFSDRLVVPGSKKTFADASKEIQKRNYRKNDAYTEKALKKEMSKLIKLQENFKEEQGLNNNEAMKYGGNIKMASGGWTPPTNPDEIGYDNPKFYEGIKNKEDVQNALVFIKDYYRDVKGNNVASNEAYDYFVDYTTKNLGINWEEVTTPTGGRTLKPIFSKSINNTNTITPTVKDPEFRINPDTGNLEYKRTGKNSGDHWVRANAGMAARYAKNQGMVDPDTKLGSREGLINEMKDNLQNIPTDYNVEPILESQPIQVEEEIIPEQPVIENMAYGGKMKYFNGGLNLSNYMALNNVLNPNIGILEQNSNAMGNINPQEAVFPSNDEMMSSIEQDKIAAKNYRNRPAPTYDNQTNQIVTNNLDTAPNNNINPNAKKPFMQSGDAIAMGMQMLPAMYNLGVGLKGSNKINYDRIDPRLLNFDASRQSTNEVYDQQGNIVNKQIRDTATGSGQALSAKIASANRLAKDKQTALSQIDEREMNMNQQIRGNTDRVNLQTSIKEEIANAQTTGTNQTAVGMGLDQLANAAGTINRDRNAFNVQENSIGILSDATGRKYRMVYNPETKQREIQFIN